MSFLHPSVLYGLIAVAIPVIIHLFDFRRTKKVYFSNTRLLHQVKESTRSFYNLKHLLILITRMLFVAALVIAFAQPYLNPQGGVGLVSGKVGLFIDNSQSMSNRVAQDELGLDLAKSLALEFIELYPAGTEFIIQSAADDKSMYAYLGKQEAINRVNELQFSSGYRPLTKVLQNFRHTVDGQFPGEVILLSDFQQSTLLQEELQPDSATHLIVLPIRFESYKNLTIDTAFISNPLEINRSKRNLMVRVRNYSAEDVTNVPVRIFANGRQLSVTSASVPARQFVDLDFTIGYDLQDKQMGEVVIEDYPVSFDNKLFFTLEETEQVNILQIMGKAPSAYVTAVFGNNKLFNQVIIQATNIDYQQLAEADLIILNQIEVLDANLASRLLGYQQGGGSVLVIPAASQSLTAYQQLLPGLLATNLDDKPVNLAVPDFNRPFFTGVLEKNDKNISMPAAKAVWNWGGDRNALLKFIDGRPYLSEVRPRLFVLASPLTAAYGGFQTNALFVPVMYRLAASSKQNIAPLFYRLNEHSLNLKVDDLTPNDILKLVRDGKEYIPQQRISGRNIIMALPGAAMQPGHYDLVKGESRVASLALNIETVESNIEPASPSELEETFAGFDYLLVNGANHDEFITKITNEYKGIVLWRYFLGLALLFLLVEALLIRLL